LKIILLAEAVYWFTFISSGLWGFQPLLSSLFADLQTTQGMGLNLVSSSVMSMGLPCLFEAIALPVALFKIIANLDVTKQKTQAIKWSLITGTLYIFVWRLNNTGMWIYTIILEGTKTLTAYPENWVSFVFTVFGLFTLGIYTAFFSKRSIGTKELDMVELKNVGLILTVTGLYFLWNYLTWIFFGKLELWSSWYTWFLGHNLDLWASSLPLAGIPMLFKETI
jgi:hypothetical protein